MRSPFVPWLFGKLEAWIVIPAYGFGERRSATAVRCIVCSSEEAAPHCLLPKSEDPLQRQLHQRMEGLVIRCERQLGAGGLSLNNGLRSCPDLVI